MSTAHASKSPSTAKTPSPPPETLPAWLPVSRGVALFLSGFLLLQVWGEMQFPSTSSVWWWIDLRPLPPLATRALMSLHGCLLLLFAVHGEEARPLRALTWCGTAALFAVSLLNAYQWYARLGAGEIATPVRIPVFLQTAAFLSVALAGLSVRIPENVERRKNLVAGMIAFDICLVLFPLAQILCLGPVDDRGDADVVVIRIPYSDSDAIEEARLAIAGELTWERPVCLIGSRESLELWSSVLTATRGEERREVHLLQSEEERAFPLAELKKLATEQAWTSALVVAEPLTLPRNRMLTARIGLSTTQLPLERAVPSDWGRILRELPALWVTYLHRNN